MRIRKRPLSSLSPVVPPLSSDPLLFSPVVQLHLPPPEEDDTAEYFNAPSSSDHLTHPIQLKKDEEEEEEEEEESSNNDNDNDHTIRSNLLGEKMDTLHDQGFSLKKRNIRGNNFDLEEDQLTDKKMKMKMKIQKRGTRGSALMEGSRCSRVNGRGWRCCQQTNVGYSLCEHHLGKGRLRSMMSVRSRGSMNVEDDDDQKEEIKKQHNNVDYSKVIMDGDHNENDKAALMILKRKTKKKLGIVKARSMSSLLGQEQGNNIISLAENNN